MSWRFSSSATSDSLPDVLLSCTGLSYRLFEIIWLSWLEMAAGRPAKSEEGWAASAWLLDILEIDRACEVDFLDFRTCFDTRSFCAFFCAAYWAVRTLSG